MQTFQVNSEHAEADASGVVHAPNEVFSLSDGQAALAFNLERITNGVFVPFDPEDAQIAFVPPFTGRKGFCFHGGDSAAARPSGYASVEWMGWVRPSNSLVQDTVITIPESA